MMARYAYVYAYEYEYGEQRLTSRAESGKRRRHAMPAPLLCLLDIDGTLLQVAEEVAFAQAFQAHCGPAVDVSFSPGLLVSDSAYIHDVLTRSYGRSATAEENAALIARFVSALDALTAS